MTQNLVRRLLSHRDLRDAPAVLLFGGPSVLVRGQRLEVPEGSKRLLVFIALSEGAIDRRHAAASLWPDGTDERAAGNLRSALWRLRCARIDIIESGCCGCAQAPSLTCGRSWTGRIGSPQGRPTARIWTR